jgi:hypothetical protein
MNKKIESCSIRLKSGLKSVEYRLNNVSDHIKVSSEKGVNALEVDLKKAIEKCEEKSAKLAGVGTHVGRFIDEIKEEGVDKFETWKTDREIHKIEKQADKKEQRAVDAIEMAAYAILEAEAAVLDALKYRKMAVEVTG